MAAYNNSRVELVRHIFFSQCKGTSCDYSYDIIKFPSFAKQFFLIFMDTLGICQFTQNLQVVVYADTRRIEGAGMIGFSSMQGG